MRPLSARRRPGTRLLRGPALVIGAILLAAGLYLLYRRHAFVALSQFPSGHARPTGAAVAGIFAVNGFTGELTAAAGGVLLLGAAGRRSARLASWLVALVLAVVAVWAAVNRDDALGLFGLGRWTIVGYGAVALLLAACSLLAGHAPVPRSATLAPSHGAEAGLARSWGATPSRGTEANPSQGGRTAPGQRVGPSAAHSEQDSPAQIERSAAAESEQTGAAQGGQAGAA
ncbi:MAG TPA: hypothetical protein VKV27_11030 [Solirubrobacteraceae bacterium]|nr:hypothetical protein [Solirubrobacteraceae bacterium]